MQSDSQDGPRQSPNLSSGPEVWEALAAIGHALQTLAASLGAQAPVAPSPRPHSIHAPRLDPVPLPRAVNEYLVHQARLDRSGRYLRQLRVVLRSLVRRRPSSFVWELTAADVRSWAESGPWSPGTRRRYVADVRGFLEWCRRREWVTGNAAADVRVPRVIDTRAPAIHTPDQVAAVMQAARVDLDVCRLLAVRYFAGLRTSEADALREDDVRTDEGLIVVPAAKAKTRRRRVVEIQPNLAAWLALGGTLRGIRPSTVRALVRSSGVPFPPNVTRHSFVSYHLAGFGSSAKTALQAGHAEAVLFSHYRALVTPAAAGRFWAIAP